jgi:hypothetical protein
MRKTLIFAAAVLPLALAACAGSLSKEDGCREIEKYSTEASTTLGRVTENLLNDQSRQRFAQRLVEIGGEAATLKIGDSEVMDALKSWTDSTIEVGTALIDHDFLGATEVEANRLFTILDEALIADSRLLRVCGR